MKGPLKKFWMDSPAIVSGLIAFLMTAALLSCAILFDKATMTQSEVMKGMLPPTEEELLLSFIEGRGCSIRKIDVVGTRVEVVLICREEVGR